MAKPPLNVTISYAIFIALAVAGIIFGSREDPLLWISSGVILFTLFVTMPLLLFYFRRKRRRTR